jgi:hypothetical protein
MGTQYPLTKASIFDYGQPQMPVVGSISKLLAQVVHSPVFSAQAMQFVGQALQAKFEVEPY